MATCEHKKQLERNPTRVGFFVCSCRAAGATQPEMPVVRETC